MKIKISIILITLIFMVIWILMGTKCKKTISDNEYWQKEGFIPDTVYIPKPYKVTDSFPYKVPPKLVIRYLPDTNHNHIKCENDSLIRVIDSLGKEIEKINKKFLTQFPSSSKLVGGMFKKDTLKLDLLNIHGDISSLLFIPNYDKFDYQYRNNTMEAKPKNNPTTSSKINDKLVASLYGGIGYEVFYHKPFTSVDCYVSYKKFQLTIQPLITLEKIPTMNLNTKVGYKIR